jgi:transcriptional regulator with GAF, ATPase, and Fis domain
MELGMGLGMGPGMELAPRPVMTDDAVLRLVERLILGRSQAIRDLRNEIASLARLRVECLLVRGETGSGKDLVPRALHLASRHLGQRSGRLVVFNCPAVPGDHLESELFGTVRGAYTGAVDRPGACEQACGGTLVFDEVGAMAPAHQAKILRLLENREGRRLGGVDTYPVDAVFAASTNEDLVTAVAAGRLREDLYYRLAQDAVLRVPPLRERREDVPLLAQAILGEMGKGELGKCETGKGETVKCEIGQFVLTPGAIALLEDQPWPGNVRELRAVVRTAGRLARDGDGPAALHAEHVGEALERVCLASKPL